MDYLKPLPPTFDSFFLGAVVFSFLIGLVVTNWVWAFCRNFVDTHREELKLQREDIKRRPTHPIIIGILERMIFTLIIASNIPGAAAGIFTWVAVKMLSGWNRYQRTEYGYKVLSFNALICTLTSLSFAIIGGLIANRMINGESVNLTLMLTISGGVCFFFMSLILTEKWRALARLHASECTCPFCGKKC
ncbi:MAG: hypothetical protein A4E69_01511 [Syntrophus sp. PtaB.Bin138]|jgi:hypothetical protein|nr:MAG: hypothetical protein A4E69_01511 [Syntrophus sp. PtaB.Bin138]